MITLLKYLAYPALSPKLFASSANLSSYWMRAAVLVLATALINAEI
jgi:hypothetical protein